MQAFVMPYENSGNHGEPSKNIKVSIDDRQ